MGFRFISMGGLSKGPSEFMTSRSVFRSMVLICGFLVVWMFQGCTVGPELYKTSFSEYNDAVRQTLDEQMLANLVRMRYYQAIECAYVPGPQKRHDGAIGQIRGGHGAGVVGQGCSVGQFQDGGLAVAHGEQMQGQGVGRLERSSPPEVSGQYGKQGREHPGPAQGESFESPGQSCPQSDEDQPGVEGDQQ